MSEAPAQSLPRQFAAWSDLNAAYRFLNNPRVDPAAIIAPHCALTREQCAGHEVVLVVQDTTWLDYSHHPATQGLGNIPGKNGHGLLQHAALAVSTDGRVLGLLAGRWMKRVQKPEGETLRQRQQRWRESQLWADAVEAIGPAPISTRFVTVGDRHADSFETFDACARHDHGFVIRAQHDRSVNGGTARLWPFMQRQPAVATMTIDLPARQGHHRVAPRKARQAEVTLRFGAVTLDPPKQDPRFSEPRSLHAVYMLEEHPPEKLEPVDWLLLTDEPLETVADAQRIIAWYRKRWVIEEWHRAEKEGCRLEDAQFDHGDDLMRLAAVTSVIAVRLMQLRDLADEMGVAATIDPAEACMSTAESSEALRRFVPPVWITAVARTGKRPVDPATLTPREFWRRIAMKGGWLARKCDGRPGWKTIWQGWRDIALIVQGIQLVARE